MNLHPKPLAKTFNIREAWLNLPDSELLRDITNLYRVYWHNAREGGSLGKYGSDVRLDYNSYSPVVKCGGHLLHPTKCRYLSESEIKRLGSFPDGYLFNNTGKIQQIIGNSVPPLFMRAIAANIRNVLFNGEIPIKFEKSLNYPQILDLAWNEHLAPRTGNSPTVISTFAGGGGSSLGYSMAGYRELLAVEWGSDAVETFKLNFPDTPVHHGDIAKLSAEQCMALAGLTKEGELDVFDGSPPCQGFSTAGKRDFTDNRNQLFREYVRLLRGLKPKVFVMENVGGMVKGKMKLIFAEIMRELKASGYQVKCQLMNARYFYVPQSRGRLIFIGVRDDIAKA